MNNKIKTVFFASLIAAMIMPFSTASMAEAAPASIESEIAKIDKETAIMEAQQESEETKELELQSYISEKKVLLHNLQQELAKAQNDNNDKVAKSLLSEISATEQTISQKESEHTATLVLIDEFDKKLVEKWNKKGELEGQDFVQKIDNLRLTDTEFASAEQTVKTILDSDSITEAQWTSLFDSLDVMLEDLGESSLDPMHRSELKDTILNDMYRQKQISQTSSYLESNFPEIHFLTASSSSCGTPRDYMPYHYQPKSDISNGNGLSKTYAKMYDGTIHNKSLSGKCIVEVTHVYHDEDMPIGDVAYDLLRAGLYGRGSIDIETYFIVVDKSSGTVDRLSFQGMTLKYPHTWPLSGQGSLEPNGIYSGSKTWNDSAHKTQKVTSFTLESQQHPKIYVNTWNHAYGESDNNSSMSDTKKSTTSYTTGSRLTAENDNTSRNYSSQTLKAAP